MTVPVSYAITDGIGVISVDNPPVNALSQAVRQGLMDAVQNAQDDDAEALVIVCAGRTFIAGADITEFGKPLKSPWLPELLQTIEDSGKLVIAALHGTALGGGFETALAAHYRCALDSAKVGLPEVHLGLLPGAGGTQRVPRLAGVKVALDLTTSGKPIAARDALAAGLIDKIVDGDLSEAAVAYAKTLLGKGAPIRKSSEQAVPEYPESIFDDYRQVLARKARGQVAPGYIVDCIEAAATLPFEEGMVVERESFLKCMESSESKAMQHLFFAERKALKIEGLAKDTPTRQIHCVGIIGGGTMGGGIAMSFANAGIPVRLIEINEEALQRGLSIIENNYAGSVRRGKLPEDRARECRSRISGSTDYADLADVDLVVEAVFEDPDLKKSIFEKLDGVCKDGAILATNTSYQDVNAIAAATKRPQDCLGMHFFSPAHIMKLLEVVRADATADDVLVTIMKLAKKIRKVSVVSGVCYGFIGNRMLQPYAAAAQRLVLEGSSPQQVDAAMERFGMAMGPFRVFDLAGLDISYKARAALSEDEKGDPASYRVPDCLVDMGRLGQKSGAGFYVYDDHRRPQPDPAVEEVIATVAEDLGIEQRSFSDDEIVLRLTSALSQEGRKILDEGIAQRSSDIDVVYVYGYGFPAARGGPMYFAEHSA